MVIMAVGSSAFAIKVPKAVNESFTKKFPGATKISWGKENEKEYEADFTLNGTKMSANFLSDGTWKETESLIAVNDLPELITTAIHNKYAGYVISSAFKIEKYNGQVNYEAELKKGSQHKEAIFNIDGMIVK